MKQTERFRFQRVSEPEYEYLTHLLSSALHFPLEQSIQAMNMIGRESFRVLYHENRIIGGMGLMRMGQWFGGRVVPVRVVIAVGIAPEHRGLGGAAFMMDRAMEEVRRSRAPLSALFPTTMALYRKSGFERAGTRITYMLPADKIPRFDSSAEMVPAGGGPADREIFRHIYNMRAVRCNGHLDRNSYLWYRALNPPLPGLKRYIVKNGDRPEGYIVYSKGAQNEPAHLLDVCCATHGSTGRILSFLSAHKTTVTNIFWQGGQQDPFLHMLPEQSVKTADRLEWMLRIVNLEKALALRGYSPELTCELHMEVEDPLFAENTGRFVLKLDHGRPMVEKGGRGLFRIDIRQLASLYSGYMTTGQLMVSSGLDGDAAEMAKADLIFAGPGPWMPDLF